MNLNFEIIISPLKKYAKKLKTSLIHENTHEKL